MNEQIADFICYCIFRKCPNFYGTGVYILHIIIIDMYELEVEW